MTHIAFTTSTKPRAFKAGGAVLLASLASACGSSGDANGDAGTATDGESQADGSNPLDGAGPRDARGARDTMGQGDHAAGSDASDGSPAESADDAAAIAAVDLGAAGHYAILAKTGISTVPTSAVTGNIGVSPAAATYITGFSLTMAPSNVFSTSPQVTGKAFAADYAAPTPSNLTAAVLDMQAAFTDAAGRAPGVTELGAGNIGGMTLSPGVYAWSTGLLIPVDVTLMGGAKGVWIFQVAKKLTVSDAAHVTLAGGALPENVFWQVAGAVSLGTTAHFEGVILSKTMINLQTGASIHGRLLAQTDVTIDDSAVVQPSP